MVDRQTASPVAFATAAAIIVALVWRLGVTGKRSAGPADAGSGGSVASDAVSSPAVSAPALEGFGVRLVIAWLLLIIVALGFGLHAVSEVQAQELPTEQYHVVADPLVFVAVGLIVAGLWRPLSRSLGTIVRRMAAVVAIAALLAWNVGHWPPLTAPDGGWPAAQAAATRLERDAGSSPMALVPLFETKGGDAYLYPLVRDGFTPVAPQNASTVVLLCDSYWLEGCGGTAEASWLAANAAGRNLVLVESFAAAPYRILTVYRRAP
jgi:hypothetical protein